MPQTGPEIAPPKTGIGTDSRVSTFGIRISFVLGCFVIRHWVAGDARVALCADLAAATTVAAGQIRFPRGLPCGPVGLHPIARDRPIA